MAVRFYPIAVLVLVLGLNVSAQEKKIDRSALPPAVEKALQAQTQNAAIKGFAQEREHGQTFYEVETLVGGRSRDILFSPQGEVVEVEEEVLFSALPANVQAGLKKKAGGTNIDKVESLTKKGRLVAYEGHMKRNGRSSEIQVGPQGENLSHAE